MSIDPSQGKSHTFTFRFGFLADSHRERGTRLSPSRRSTERDNNTVEESDGDEESTERNADCFIVGENQEAEAESSRFCDRNGDSSRKRKRDPESIEVSRGIAEPSRFESRTTESPKERRK
ncbi:hypothetical protein IGI04_018683 [Brassica rapa subsp. trilocularis]|uniref:Uncharacterized protein n=1 Tax=Brassica rapa subsp. trilocularis TaxID=1813537 RepID=A0ABQ7MH45_BRACM|nr:hypothetical protein IGI04_018683 [Brassica rapa subsp. trilocularis]